MTDRTPVWFEGDLKDRVTDRLEYGDSFAEFVRDSVRLRLELSNSDEDEILGSIPDVESIEA